MSSEPSASSSKRKRVLSESEDDEDVSENGKEVSSETARQSGGTGAAGAAAAAAAAAAFSDDDSDEDEDEDDSEDDDYQERTTKRRKKSAASQLFEDDAEEDEDESVVHQEDREDENVRRMREEAEQRRELRRKREKNNLQEKSAEEIARHFAMKDRQQNAARKKFKKLGEETLILYSSQNIPDIQRDPSLFAVKCKPGMEKQLVCQILNKATVLSSNPKRALRITSAIATRTRGYVYIEARNVQHVKNAVMGMNGLYVSKVSKVAVTEMRNALDIPIKADEVVKVDSWVRIKSGHFKGDLGKVVKVSQQAKKAVVRLMPRVSLTRPIIDPITNKIMKPSKRAPQGFFDRNAVAAFVRSVNESDLIAKSSRIKMPEQRDYQPLGLLLIYYKSNYYTHSGWMCKEWPLKSLIKDVSPTLEEATQFSSRKPGLSDGSNNDFLEEEATGGALESLTKGSERGKLSMSETERFLEGDVVRVVAGELKDLLGKVVMCNSSAGTISIKPIIGRIEGLANEYTFDAADLVKHFEVGKHVKVVSGQFSGETGSIVKISEVSGKGEAVIILDSGSREVRIFTSALRESDEIAEGIDSLDGYKLFDLVVLPDNLRGLIVHVGRERLRILNQGGSTQELSPTDLRGSRNMESKKAIALDKRRQQVSVNDVIRVVEGQFKGYSGKVKQISRRFLFVQSNQHMQDAGAFVVQAQHVTLAGSQSTKDLSMLSMGLISSDNSVPRRNVSRRNVGRALPICGKTVRITKGEWKGYIGMVLSATDSWAQVELHTRHKTVQIKRDSIQQIGDSHGSLVPDSNRGRFGGSHVSGRGRKSAVALTGAATPVGDAFAAQTPLNISLGGTTPMVAGSSTPGGVWDADASTPFVAETPLFSNTDGGDYGYNGAGAQAPSNYPQHQGQYLPPAELHSSYAYSNDGHMPPPASNHGQIKTWVNRGLVVEISQQGDHNNCRGVVRTVYDDRMCDVDITDPAPRGVVKVSERNLKPVRPRKGDRVVILPLEDESQDGAEYAGQQGILQNLDDEDAVVFLQGESDGGSEMQFFNINLLCKIASA